MKEKFKDYNPTKVNKEKLRIIISIIEEYYTDGYTMTLRQLYYQLVSRDVIPNTISEYGKLSKLLSKARMAGLIDWNAIEDRIRIPYIPYYNSSPKDAIEDTISQYRLDRQIGQDTYIEVWVEKDAISGILKRVTNKYHVRLLVNRGYGSVTSIHDAYIRYMNRVSEFNNCVVLYLGDHDPSGLDMIRDINDRINEMLEAKGAYDFFEIKPIALTMEQINKYNPPKNPAKLKDPRSKWYVSEFGYSSWEVDALDPKTLNELLSNEIEVLMDMGKYEDMLKEEIKDKEILKGALDYL